MAPLAVALQQMALQEKAVPEMAARAMAVPDPERAGPEITHGSYITR